MLTKCVDKLWGLTFYLMQQFFFESLEYSDHVLYASESLIIFVGEKDFNLSEEVNNGFLVFG